MNFRIFIALVLCHVLYFVSGATYPERYDGKPWERIKGTDKIKDINMYPNMGLGLPNPNWKKPTKMPMTTMPVTKARKLTKMPMTTMPVTKGKKPTKMPMGPMPITKGKMPTKMPMDPMPVTKGKKPTKMPMDTIRVTKGKKPTKKPRVPMPVTKAKMTTKTGPELVSAKNSNVTINDTHRKTEVDILPEPDKVKSENKNKAEISILQIPHKKSATEGPTILVTPEIEGKNSIDGDELVKEGNNNVDSEESVEVLMVNVGILPSPAIAEHDNYTKINNIATKPSPAVTREDKTSDNTGTMPSPTMAKDDSSSEGDEENEEITRVLKQGTMRIPAATKDDESSDVDEETKIPMDNNGTMPSPVATKDDKGSENEEEKKMNANFVNELNNITFVTDKVTMQSPISTEDYDRSESHEETKGRVDGITGEQTWTTTPTKTTRGDFIFKFDI